MSAVVTSPLRRALLGVAFVALITLLLGFTVAKFQQRLPWQRTVPVTLKVGTAGTQLNKNADVKLRGIVVGRVAEQRATADGAELSLALNPGDVALIPADVTARILPKTLFGEKFVDLVIPKASTAQPIEAHAVISQDRSEEALEVERVLEELFPLLRSLQPERLNAALTAISEGLRGRGDQLGAALARLDAYLAGIQNELPTIQADLSGLADLAESLGDSAPDLLRLARASTVSARTVTEQEDVLIRFLSGIASFADVTSEVLERDGDRLIRLAESSRPILQVLHDRRGQLPATVAGLEDLVADLNSALRPNPARPEGALSIRLELVPNRGAYTPADRPTWRREGGSVASVGGAEEKALLGALLGGVLHLPPAEVPDVVVVLFGPLLRGSEVAAR